MFVVAQRLCLALQQQRSGHIEVLSVQALGFWRKSFTSWPSVPDISSALHAMIVVSHVY